VYFGFDEKKKGTRSLKATANVREATPSPQIKPTRPYTTTRHARITSTRRSRTSRCCHGRWWWPLASALGPPARRRWRWRWRASKAAARHRSTSAPPVPRPDWASRSTGGRSQAPHAFRRFVCGARGDTDTDAYVRGGAAGSTASSYPHARGTSTAWRLTCDSTPFLPARRGQRRRHRFFVQQRE
jgi:hypothetical protein